MRFPHLFSPFRLGGLEFKNRIFSTGHDTSLTRGMPNDALRAYHEARAKGGAGLVITEVAAIHGSAIYHPTSLRADTDDCIPGFQAIAKAVHAHDCRLFGQLFHAGREVLESEDGTVPAAYSASDTPNERFHIVPRAMPAALIGEMVECYGAAAARLTEAGFDGVEIVASHGYLPAQFLNPRINQRTDSYGGPIENRIRFLAEIAAAARRRIGRAIVGLRISGAEPDQHDGLSAEETLAICQALAPHFDYFNVTIGSVATLGGSIHSVPPMMVDPGYVAPLAGGIKARIGKPVFVAGRINRPDVAERILAAGQADMCAMTRGMIADPQLPNKAREGRVEDIRSCIGCNQACIGHIQKGVSVSCIQYPESGRELVYGTFTPARSRKRVIVVGGGPAGLKATAIAAARGHAVTLYEREARLGGQVRLAERLPGRAEFGGIAENLAHEARRAGARIEPGVSVTAAMIRDEAPDALIIATGAKPRPLDVPSEGGHVVDAWTVIKGQANVGGSVVIADWRCDWVGMGLAEMLAREGRRVRLCVNGYMPGQMIQMYVRDPWLGTLQKLGVEVIPLVRLAGIDADTAYFQHTTNGEPVLFDGVETVVTNLARQADDELIQALDGWPGALHVIGDALAPRTAEEAVLDGLRTAWDL
ncbi:MAG: FAD-dependent oxidoreductase [Alphaproteobacteria bacterium]